MNRYKVKFKDKKNNVTRFGIVENYSKLAKDYLKAGLLLIADATRGVSYAVEDDANVEDIPHSIPKIDPNTWRFIPQDDYEQHVQDEQDKAEEISKNAGEGVVKGKLFTTPVGDGCAFYVIVKVNKKSVKIEWRSFQGDRWVDQHFGYGGTYPRSQVEQFVKWQDGWQKNFGKKKVN